MKTLISTLGLFVHATLAFGAAGETDITFNPSAGASSTIRSLGLSTNGSVVIGGSFFTVDNLVRYYVARLSGNGALDSGFDVGQGPNGQIYSLAPLQDGKVLVAGNFTAINDILRGGVARLRADASVDLSFQNPQFSSTVLQITVLPNSQILAVGLFTSVAGTPRQNVARLHANGALDLMFNPTVGVTNNSVLSAVVQPDNKVILAGDFPSIGGTAHRYIARVMTNGSVDASFDAGFIGGNNVSQLLLQADGKILLAGNFNSIDGYSRLGIARLQTNGMLDTSFVVPNGISTVSCMALQPDGKILVGFGSGYTAPPPASFSQYYFLRLDTAGNADPLFRPNLNGTVFTTALQPDGRILIGGGFQSLNGTNLNRIARLLNDATATGAVSQVTITFHAGITISGTAGEQYRIESTTNLTTPTLWLPVTNVTLGGNSATTYDPTPVSRRQTYYRAVLTP